MGSGDRWAGLCLGRRREAHPPGQNAARWLRSLGLVSWGVGGKGTCGEQKRSWEWDTGLQQWVAEGEIPASGSGPRGRDGESSGFQGHERPG